MEEWNDIYDEDRNLTGRRHLRGTAWEKGDYGLVVCVWVYDGEGNLLLTRRAPEKSYAGTWENSGGAARAGEDSLTAVRRELYEETGILAEPDAFEKLGSGRDENHHYDFFCLKCKRDLSQIRLLPGETDDVMWADFDRVHHMIHMGKICEIIGKQFFQDEKALRLRNVSKFDG